MKIKRIISIISMSFIVFLMAFIALTKDGGYITKEDKIKEVIKVDVSSYEYEKSAEDIQLEKMKKNVGEITEIKTSKLFVSKCSSCHGKNGDGRMGSDNTVLSPKIRGKSVEFITKKLDDYKNNRAENPLMKGLLMNISDKDIENLANEISKF